MSSYSRGDMFGIEIFPNPRMDQVFLRPGVTRPLKSQSHDKGLNGSYTRPRSWTTSVTHDQN